MRVAWESPGNVVAGLLARWLSTSCASARRLLDGSGITSRHPHNLRTPKAGRRFCAAARAEWRCREGSGTPCLDRAREGLLRTACIRVEDGGDVPDEDAAERRQLHLTAAQREQPLALQLGEARELPLKSCRDLDPEVAHEPGDQRAPYQIFGRERDSATGGERALADGVLVARKPVRVLRVEAADVADRRDPERDHLRRSLHGVALEVAAEPSSRPRLCELVVGQREVIHADLPVAGGRQGLPREPEQVELVLAAGNARNR